MLLVRPADLPGLHDADARGHALPGVLRAAHQVHTMRSTTSEPRVTVGMIIACAVVFLATNGFSGGLGRSCGTSSRSSGPPSTSATTTGGWSPRASCTRARSTSSSTCTCCGCSATARAHARLRALRGAVLHGAAVGSVRRARRHARRADGRRLGRGLRADGRGRRRAARARHQPVQDRHRRADPAQPRAVVRDQRASRSAGTSAAWSAGILVGVAFEGADRMRRRELGYLGCVVLSAVAVVGALAAGRLQRSPSGAALRPRPRGPRRRARAPGRDAGCGP